MAPTGAPPYLQKAFFHGINLTALGVFGTAALATANPVLLGAGVAFELLWMAFVPRLPGFRRGIDSERRALVAAEATEQADRMLAELAPNQRELFLQLRELKGRILENHQRLGSTEMLLESTGGRIDQLLASFLKLLHTLDAYRKSLHGPGRQEVERELATLIAESEREPAGEKLREVREKRAGILRKRLERYDQAREHRELISHQLASIEDLLRLLHEQSIGLRDPGLVDQQLDTMVAEAESTEATLRDLQAFLAIDGSMAALPTEATGRTQARVRG